MGLEGTTATHSQNGSLSIPHAFLQVSSLEKIRELKKFYELDLDSSASHRLKEIKARSGRKRKESA